MIGKDARDEAVVKRGRQGALPSSNLVFSSGRGVSGQFAGQPPTAGVAPGRVIIENYQSGMKNKLSLINQCLSFWDSHWLNSILGE